MFQGIAIASFYLIIPVIECLTSRRILRTHAPHSKPKETIR